MSDRKQHGAGATVLLALAIIAGGLAGGGTLMASGEEQLLREAARLAAESPLEPGLVEEPVDPDGDTAWDVGTRAPAKSIGQPGVILTGTSADLAVHRAVEFLMSRGSVEEGRRIVTLLVQGAVRVGPGPQGWSGIAVPRSCAELTPAEEADPDRGLPRTVTLGRALLLGLWSLPPERPDGKVTGPAPGPVAAWTRTLQAMSGWVRSGTRGVEEAAGSGGDARMSTWRGLVLVEAMRSALRDYGDLGWCNDGRGESWKSLSASLARTRILLKRKLGEPVRPS